MLRLVAVDRPGIGLERFKQLLGEYQRALPIELDFQGFEDEFADPLSKYGPPMGRILLAEWNGELAGCGALWNHGDWIAEIKRVYVRDNFRRKGMARAISARLIEEARAMGYSTIWADTLRRLQGAVELYLSFGFAEVEPFNENPHLDVVYLELDLT